MDELIIHNHAISVEFKNQLIFKKRMLDEIKKEYDDMVALLKQAMEETDTLKIETDELNVSYVDATYSERFDKNAFIEAVGKDEYDKYVKIVPVKASIRIKEK